MSVYFAQPVVGGPVKIGCAADVPGRIRDLEEHYGKPLVILATMEGGREEERAIHERFAHLRLRGAGKRGGQVEQFRPDPELMAFIGRPLLAGSNPDVVEAMIPRGRTIGVLVSAEYAEWLKELAMFCRTDVSKMIDVAITEFLQRQGFTEPPPPRIPR